MIGRKKEKQRSFTKEAVLFVFLAIAAVLMTAQIPLMLRAYQAQQARKLYSMASPKETYYFDLEYADVTNALWAQYPCTELVLNLIAQAWEPLPEMQHLCTELAAEDKCVFEADRNYRVRFKFPEQLRREAQIYDGHWAVDVEYTSTIESDDSMPMIWARVYNADTGNLYIAQSAFNVTEDVAQVQHRLILSPEEEKGITLDEFTKCSLSKMESLDFILKTSSESDGEARIDTGDNIYAWTIHGEQQ